MTKLRIVAAVAGGLLALGGVLTLFVAITLALAGTIGLTAAAFLVAGTGILLAGLCVLFCVQPYRSMREEVDDVEEVTAETLADLPIDTVRNFVEQRPLTTTALAMALGYSVIRHPHAARRHAERLLFSVL